MFCPASSAGRRSSNVISRPSAQARSASDRSVISASPDNSRLMSERRPSSRRASSCWVTPARLCSVTALSNSLRTRPINLPAVRDRSSISKRKNVIGVHSLYTQRRIDTEFAPQPADRNSVSTVEIMIFYCVSPIAEHGDKAILRHEPAEYPDIRRLQFPDRIVFRANHAELSCKDQLLAAQERMKKIVDLLGR